MDCANKTYKILICKQHYQFTKQKGM